MARRTWNSERFEKWENETHIPEDVQKMVDIVCEQLGIDVEETTIEHQSVFGVLYGFSKGYVLSHCTSSLADGPSEDMAPVFIKWLEGLGFHVENSYGDNGLDSATNWHDTYWFKEISYGPSLIYEDTFWDLGNNDEGW